MREQMEQRLGELARRAGLTGAPPAVVVAALVVCLVVVIGAAWRWWPRQSVSPLDAGISAQPAASAQATDTGSATTSSSVPVSGESTLPSTSSAVYVHVVGAVRRPGLYELPSGARVADAVESAGGLLANAAPAGINLARPVADGEQISVPTADEVARGVVGGATGSGPAASPPGTGASGAAQGLVNINTADAMALDSLPGVGPSTAEKIVADRAANGPFTSADDLGRVAGIGPKKLEELKPRVCVR